MASVSHHGAASRNPPPPLDVAEMRQQLGDDEGLVADVIALFLADHPHRVAAIRAAVGARDTDQIRRASHTLKGAAGNLSASRVVQVASELEARGASGDLRDVDDLLAALVQEVNRLTAALVELQSAPLGRRP